LAPKYISIAKAEYETIFPNVKNIPLKNNLFLLEIFFPIKPMAVIFNVIGHGATAISRPNRAADNMGKFELVYSSVRNECIIARIFLVQYLIL
jgi:hypothetical protein